MGPAPFPGDEVGTGTGKYTLLGTAEVWTGAEPVEIEKSVLVIWPGDTGADPLDVEKSVLVIWPGDTDAECDAMGTPGVPAEDEALVMAKDVPTEFGARIETLVVIQVWKQRGRITCGYAGE